MEWENWLDKKVLDHGKQRKTDDFADPDKSLLLDTEPDKTIPQIKRDFDDETHEDPYSTKSWESWLEKKDINDNYKKLMDRATELSPNSCEDNEHCGATSGAINEQLKDGKQKLSHIRGITNDKDHAYNKNRKGHIIDASREQFGDKKGIHVIKPDDERYKEYEDVMPHKKNPFLDRISLVDEKKSWELFLEKNNAIETSHKDEKEKDEWDGKFSSSTIRDDAENDDDKAIGEEESLEELTDGKLEEVEKLKSWEVFLDKTSNQYPQDKLPEKKDEDGDVQINYETGTKLNDDGTITDSKHRKIEDEGSSDNLTTRFSRGNLKGKKQGAGRKGYNNAGDSGGVPKGHAGKFGKGGKTFGAEQFSHNSGDSPRPNADGTRTTIDGLRQQIQRINENENKKVLSPTGQPAAEHQEEVADIENVGKSWEVWLEKTTKEPNVGTRNGIPHPAARTAKEIEVSAQQAASTGDVDIGTLTPDMKKKKSWEEWVEKMQGAGDARYGNQHLTGMEQNPVSDDESMELSAETDENNEKQEKKEDKEDKDNKPYKALSQE